MGRSVRPGPGPFEPVREIPVDFKSTALTTRPRLLCENLATRFRHMPNMLQIMYMCRLNCSGGAEKFPRSAFAWCPGAEEAINSVRRSGTKFQTQIDLTPEQSISLAHFRAFLLVKVSEFEQKQSVAGRYRTAAVPVCAPRCVPLPACRGFTASS